MEPLNEMRKKNVCKHTPICSNPRANIDCENEISHRLPRRVNKSSKKVGSSSSLSGVTELQRKGKGCLLYHVYGPLT